MKILLHACCGPCSIYPLEVLRDGHQNDVMLFFYRHNIHPYTECVRREETLKAYTDSQGLTLISQKDYDMEGFIRAVVFREKDRCRYCYHDRLTSAARVARKGKFEGFTTTLLYSRFQNHDLIRSTGEAVAKKEGVPFVYEDFRKGWKQGIEASKALGMYRQQYCGCIYSETERFYRSS